MTTDNLKTLIQKVESQKATIKSTGKKIKSRKLRTVSATKRAKITQGEAEK